MRPVSPHRRAVGIVLVLVFMGVFASRAMAQTQATELTGVVQDSSGGVIPNAVITLMNMDTGFKRTASSDVRGYYAIPLLTPGNYKLTVQATGFQTISRSGIQLLVNSPATVNISLPIGIVTQKVEVSAQAVTLNMTDATLGIAFNENQVKQLPLEGRNVPDLLTLQAGVVYTGNRPDVDRDIYDTRSGAVNGARSDQSNVTVDGVPVNDEGGHAFTSVLPVTLDSVQEFRVITTNYNPDHGSSSGAQVALVTKSGTNDFHGSVYEYHRNTYTSANDFFVKQTELLNNQPNVPPKLIRNIFGTSVGGPVLKDRFFFFLNYEGTRRAEAQDRTFEVPSPSLRDGVIIYQCDTSDPNLATDCPGGSVSGLTPGSSYSFPKGYHGLSPAQITAMDPLHLGPSSVMINYLNQGWPVPNTSSVGDGFTFSGFNFRGPISATKNWYIGKLDYNMARDHRVSLTGALANENLAGAPFLPGHPPEQTTVNYNKGLIVNYTGVISQNLVNSFRYGFVRESVGVIVNSFPQVIFFFLNNQSEIVPGTHAFQQAIHNLADDLSWIRGKHTLQLGASAAFIRSSRSSYVQSFSVGYANPYWMNPAGFAGQPGSQLNPANSGYPGVDSGFGVPYDLAVTDLLGMVPKVAAQYNYQRDGTPQAQGAPVQRRFAINDYEFYGQDTWKIRPTLTLTYGLRWSLFSAPWETNGLQVSPTFSLARWFRQRAINMENGVPSAVDPPVTFDWSGPANGKKGYWGWDYKDLGPRIALAWSPKASSGLLKGLFGDGGRTSIRAGFGIVYDRFGQGIVDAFDHSGSFGMSSTILNLAGSQTDTSVPRLTGINTIPRTDNNGNVIFQPAPTTTFPKTVPVAGLPTATNLATQWSMDDSVKTPYAYTMDFSVGRELPVGFSLEVSYVGRLSHRLLNQQDLAMPLDLRDKKSGLDYFTAATALAKLYRAGVTSATFDNSMVNSAVAQYWQDIIQPVLPGGAYSLGFSGGCGSGAPASTTNPVLMAFDLFCGGKFTEVIPLQLLDISGVPDATLTDRRYFTFTGHPHTFWNPQFASMYAWRSTAAANYHAMQVNFRHKMSHGVQFDFNYTFSKSIDTASDAERVALNGYGGLGDYVINSWQPNALRAVSTFDATHQINSNWLVELPFGRGRAFGRAARGWQDAIIGGWQLSGLFRITSGFPVTIFNNGGGGPTNWSWTGDAVKVGPVKTGAFAIHSGPDAGNISIFANGPDAVASFRSLFPGESGVRNQIRGSGYFGVDMGLAKRWRRMPWSERQSLQLRWEVFNITNSVRFDVQSVNKYLGSGNTFGNYTKLLTNPRVMQFALRYEF